MNKFWIKLKPLVTTWKGWLCIVLAILIGYSPGWIPFVVGWILHSPTLMLTGSAIVITIAQPFIPMWIIIPAIAFLLKRYLLK